MKIAITGAGGFVGKELTRFFSTQHHVLALTRHNLDITDSHAVRRMITDVRPDLVINCAVYGACSYYEFALEVARDLRMSSAEIDSLIEAVTESEMRRHVPRPRYTPMRCLASEELGLPALRCWRTALSQYLNGAELAVAMRQSHSLD